MADFDGGDFDMVDPDTLKLELVRLYEIIKAVQAQAPITTEAIDKRIEEVEEWKFGRLPKKPCPANYWTFAVR